MLLDKIKKPLPFRTQEEIMSGWSETAGPLVSVLCATFNHADYIEHAISGFLGQITGFQFEVIIRDDASTDGTADIVRSYASKYPCIIRPIFKTVNQYPEVRPLPEMISASKGQFIAVCEGDDYWTDPKKIEKQAQYLTAHPECALVCQPHINAFNASDHIVSVGHARERALFLTRMFKKSDIKDFPAELLSVPNGDRAQLVHLATKGEIVHLSGLSPAVRQMHEGGVMSQQPEIIQLNRQVETWKRIYEFYKGTKYGSFLWYKNVQFHCNREKFLANHAQGFIEKVKHRIGFLYYRACSLPFIIGKRMNIRRYNAPF